MGIKRYIRKIAKFILESSPEKHVSVNISQINYNETLKGKNIIITGGSKGIGLAIAKKCISEGANVLITGRNEESLKKAKDELGENLKYIIHDISNVETIDTFLEEAQKSFNGRIDSLVSNAGISLHENHYKNVTIDGFDKQFNTNFRAGYFLAKKFLEMKEKNKEDEGNLIFITSETGNQAYDIPYGLTKAALNSLTQALSRRVYKQGIRVNAIAPGVTVSDMTKDYAEVSDGNYFRKSASDRIFLPEEIAEVACFLLSDASKCISGEIIHCNAGNHIKTFWEE